MEQTDMVLQSDAIEEPFLVPQGTCQTRAAPFCRSVSGQRLGAALDVTAVHEAASSGAVFI
ncbi:hypothetical protein EYF80_036974 [Liparis tanakae]|uniref:Uncharacterized protein n=1 Tax=Liparis tanakae TaxID=230148 RepID=A0A4Z2GHK0_9TELE|nr:hypothetical protein EYF80_036974 [Liparis tanakae]